MNDFQGFSPLRTPISVRPTSDKKKKKSRKKSVANVSPIFNKQGDVHLSEVENTSLTEASRTKKQTKLKLVRPEKVTEFKLLSSSDEEDTNVNDDLTAIADSVTARMKSASKKSKKLKNSQEQAPVISAGKIKLESVTKRTPVKQKILSPIKKPAPVPVYKPVSSSESESSEGEADLSISKDIINHKKASPIKSSSAQEPVKVSLDKSPQKSKSSLEKPTSQTAAIESDSGSSSSSEDEGEKEPPKKSVNLVKSNSNTVASPKKTGFVKPVVPLSESETSSNEDDLPPKGQELPAAKLIIPKKVASKPMNVMESDSSSDEEEPKNPASTTSVKQLSPKKVASTSLNNGASPKKAEFQKSKEPVMESESSKLASSPVKQMSPKKAANANSMNVSSPRKAVIQKSKDTMTPKKTYKSKEILSESDSDSDDAAPSKIPTPAATIQDSRFRDSRDGSSDSDDSDKNDTAPENQSTLKRGGDMSPSKSPSKKLKSSLIDEDDIHITHPLTQLDPKTKYDCPDDFESLSEKSDILTVENMDEHSDLWLIRVPINFDIKALDNVSLSTGKTITLENSGEFEANKMRGAVNSTLLLPSGKHSKQLKPVHQFKGIISITEKIDVPEAKLPKVKPKMCYDIPAGLKQRHVAFGSDKPTKTPDQPVKKRKRASTSAAEGASTTLPEKHAKVEITHKTTKPKPTPVADQEKAKKKKRKDKEDKNKHKVEKQKESKGEKKQKDKNKDENEKAAKIKERDMLEANAADSQEKKTDKKKKKKKKKAE
ncbi:uncharacterized protein LOC141902873 [Tubulanus polymorphus]|uniref:uncharacterized protein LOC141902873 n=1 Tax=Tubulanus polymorphus TaxID=672921 RepID=UPI003DA5640F